MMLLLVSIVSLSHILRFNLSAKTFFSSLLSPCFLTRLDLERGAVLLILHLNERHRAERCSSTDARPQPGSTLAKCPHGLRALEHGTHGGNVR